jgi:hypothetical protein
MDSKAANEVRVQGHLISREPLIYWGASDIPCLAGPGSTLGWLARSHVGLCLSAVEGHMQACTEYLLCGLPVVSIPNKGARDLVLDPAYSIEAEPTPAAVAAAVQALKARQLDPHRIRAAAIAKLKPNRMRLLQLIAMIHREENVPFPDEADWVRIFRLSLWPYKTVAALLAEDAVSETRRGDGAPAAHARRA